MGTEGGPAGTVGGPEGVAGGPEGVAGGPPTVPGEAPEAAGAGIAGGATVRAWCTRLGTAGVPAWAGAWAWAVHRGASTSTSSTKESLFMVACNL